MDVVLSAISSLNPSDFSLLLGKPTMAKKKSLMRRLGSCTLYGVDDKSVTVKAGDSVMIKPDEPGKASFVARVERIESDKNRNNVEIKVRWYYRPEESEGGRRHFHGAKEVFLSDHFDVQNACTIEGTCTVHSFMEYTNLEKVGTDDYFCRFEYNTETHEITPESVAVYCKCEMPYNPDHLMMQCEECEDWFHPSCVGMTLEAAMELQSYMCADCEAKTKAKATQRTK